MNTSNFKSEFTMTAPESWYDKRDNLWQKAKEDRKGKVPVVPGFLIEEGDKVVWEEGATICVFVVLYDKENSRGGIVHIAGPKGIKNKLIPALNEMREKGSEKIVYLLSGGIGEAGSENLEAVRETMSEQKDVFCYKNKKLYPGKNHLLLFFLDDGIIKTAFYNSREEAYGYEEFKIPYEKIVE